MSISKRTWDGDEVNPSPQSFITGSYAYAATNPHLSVGMAGEFVHRIGFILLGLIQGISRTFTDTSVAMDTIIFGLP